jgi:hypothetical protein
MHHRRRANTTAHVCSLLPCDGKPHLAVIGKEKGRFSVPAFVILLPKNQLFVNVCHDLEKIL